MKKITETSKKCSASYHPPLRIRFSLNNIKKDGNLINLPIFLADWVRGWMP